MNTNWYEGVNPNLDRLTQLLSMSKPSHGYTIAEKAPEVVTAPGVYFPAQKGEVIPLKPRQDGGEVTPSKSLPEDKETAKLEMLMSIISKVNPSNLESKSMMGLNFPPESMSIEKTKYDILKAAISVLKPPKQPSEGKPSSKPSSSTTEGDIPLESRHRGGSVTPDINAPFPSLPGIPKPPTSQSYGIQPDALKVGTADKGMSESDLLWQKKQSEDWGPGASRIVGGKRVDWQEGMDTPFDVPMLSMAKGGGTTTPVFGESEGIGEEERLRLMAAMKPSATNAVDMTPNAVGTFEAAPEADPYSRVDIPQTPKPFYTGPEGTMTVAPETPESKIGDELARSRIKGDITKQETERELLAKSQGYGQDLGYWAAHPEEKAQYDLEQMLSRYPQKERLELIKNMGKATEKEPTPHLVDTEKGPGWAFPPGGGKPARIVPAGYVPTPKETKAPTIKSERTFDPITGQTYEQDYEFVNDNYQPTGQRRMVGGPAPEKPEKSLTLKDYRETDEANRREARQVATTIAAKEGYAGIVQLPDGTIDMQFKTPDGAAKFQKELERQYGILTSQSQERGLIPKDWVKNKPTESKLSEYDQAVDAIKQRPDKADVIKKKYKERTGMEFK